MAEHNYTVLITKQGVAVQMTRRHPSLALMVLSATLFALAGVLFPRASTASTVPVWSAAPTVVWTNSISWVGTPAVAVDSQGFPHAIWSYCAGVDVCGWMYSRQLADGTWQFPEILVAPPEGRHWQGARLFLTHPGDTPLVIANVSNSNITVSRTRLGPNSWSATSTLPDLVYLDLIRQVGSSLRAIAQSSFLIRDAAGTWSAQPFDQMGVRDYQVDAAGRDHILYRIPSEPDFYYRSREAGGVWESGLRVSQSGGEVGGPALALGAPGRVYTVWTESRQVPCFPIMCTETQLYGRDIVSGTLEVSTTLSSNVTAPVSGARLRLLATEDRTVLMDWGTLVMRRDGDGPWFTLSLFNGTGRLTLLQAGGDVHALWGLSDRLVHQVLVSMDNLPSIPVTVAQEPSLYHALAADPADPRKLYLVYTRDLRQTLVNASSWSVANIRTATPTGTSQEPTATRTLPPLLPTATWSPLDHQIYIPQVQR